MKKFNWYGLFKILTIIFCVLLFVALICASAIFCLVVLCLIIICVIGMIVNHESNEQRKEREEIEARKEQEARILKIHQQTVRENEIKEQKKQEELAHAQEIVDFCSSYVPDVSWLNFRKLYRVSK